MDTNKAQMLHAERVLKTLEIATTQREIDYHQAKIKELVTKVNLLEQQKADLTQQIEKEEGAA